LGVHRWEGWQDEFDTAVTTPVDVKDSVKVTDYLANCIHEIDKVCLSGSFMKLFDISSTAVVNLKDVEGIPIRILTQGHDYIMVRCMQSKKGLDGSIQQSFTKESDLLCVLCCEGPINQPIYYNAQHIGSKMQLMNSSIQSVDLAFMDKWNEPLTGMVDFIAEITVDFLRLNPPPDKLSIREVKHMLT
jgi:hypothetical protein